MHVELLVPGLLAIPPSARYPAVETLLARGRRTRGKSHFPMEAWLVLACQPDAEDLPAGYLTALVSGEEADQGHWVRADPVHLKLMRDRVAIIPAEALEISREEAEALCSALNAHFGDAMKVKAYDARRWSARVQERHDLDGYPALHLAGRAFSDKRAADRELTEMQMVLHAHPVNAARESRGEPAINSLWLWGAGGKPKVEEKWASVLANEPVSLGLARLAKARHGVLTESASGWLERAPTEGRHLVVLDALRASAEMEDRTTWSGELQAMEAAWFVPLLQALRAGRLGMISMHDPVSGVSSEIVRGDLRRFWKRPRPLASFA